MTVVECPQCEKPMRWRGNKVTWRGDYEFEDQDYECPNACMTRAVVVYSTYIPIDVARTQSGV